MLMTIKIVDDDKKYRTDNKNKGWANAITQRATTSLLLQTIANHNE